MNRMICSAALLATLATLAGGAQAQDSTFKFGLTRYDTHSKTNGVSGIGIPPGADAYTGDATTVIFVYEYEFMPNLGIELVLGVPPRIKGYGSGSVAFLGEVLVARNVAPTLLLNYHFGQPGDSFRPYVGAGINYTRFTGISSRYGFDISLSDSWGPVAQVGLDYSVNKQWGAYASVAAVKVKSDLVAVGATVLQTTIDFRPLVYSVGVSYRF